jgi:hypothetical protein
VLMRDLNVRQAMFQASAKGRAAVAAKAAPESDQQVGAEALERLGRGSGWIWAACCRRSELRGGRRHKMKLPAAGLLSPRFAQTGLVRAKRRAYSNIL